VEREGKLLNGYKHLSLTIHTIMRWYGGCGHITFLVMVKLFWRRIGTIGTFCNNRIHHVQTELTINTVRIIWIRERSQDIYIVANVIKYFKFQHKAALW